MLLSGPIAAQSIASGNSATHAPALVASQAGASQSQSVPWLLGDWNGARTQLQNLGIDFQFSYTSEFAYNATGGVRSTGTYTDQYTAGATLDLDRLFGVRDATFQATFTERTGHNLSEDAGLRTLQLVQEVFGRGQTARLTQFWFDQKYLNGAVDWKVGRMTFGEDFASFSCDFQNLTFCGAPPGNILGDYILNWPVSGWATRLRFNFSGFGYFQVGVYDVNPKYLGLRAAVVPAFFSGSTGAMIPVELAWLPNFGGKLPGSYKVGAWYDTSTANDVVSDINGNPFAVTGLPPIAGRGRFGGYISISQQLTPLSAPNSKSGLSAFLNATIADDRTSRTDAQVAGGLMYTGLFRSRPNDDIAFAVGMTHVNSRVADAQILQNEIGLGPVPVQGSEYVMELYYTFRPTSGLLFRPNVQHVIHPGGISQNKDALIFGLKTSASF
ncbi:porin [Bradyrhizobium sp. Leo121]|nr:porin [Bradyrhizobium sp. Leo121]